MKKALIAELIGGEMARKMGLKVPEIVFMELDDSFGRTEGDVEIQDLLKFSVGLNLGLHYLAGAITYDPLVSEVDALSASKVVLLDSMITNVDRTFPAIKDHDLLVKAEKLEEAAEVIKSTITDQELADIVSVIPDDWLEYPELDESPAEMRDIYLQFLAAKLHNIDTLTKEASDARKASI